MKPRTLRSQLAFWYGGFALVILGGFGTFLYTTLARNLYRGVDEKLLSLAEVVAESSVRNFLRPGYNDFARLLEEFFGVPAAGQFIQVLDPAGNVGSRSENLIKRRLPVSRDTLRRALHGIRVYETHIDGTLHLRVLTYPVVVRGRVRNVVQVATGLAPAMEALGQVRWVLVVGSPVVLGIALLGGWILAGRALRPLDAVVDGLRALDADTLADRIPETSGTEEIRDLAQNINALLARLSDAFRRVREFTADASHELRTPLTVLRGEAEVALRRPRPPEEYQDVLASSLEEIHRMGRIVEDLLLLAKGDLGEVRIEKRSVNLDPFLSDLAGQAQMVAESRGLRFTYAGGPPATLSADPLRLRQLIWNLVDNAIKYTPEGGQVFVSYARVETGWVRITVKDTGVGIPPDQLDRVFERFFRVDKHRARAQGGSGLGLAICRWAAEAHGGHIKVRSTVGEGSSFLVYLPEEGERDGLHNTSTRTTPDSGDST